MPRLPLPNDELPYEQLPEPQLDIDNIEDIEDIEDSEDIEDGELETFDLSEDDPIDEPSEDIPTDDPGDAQRSSKTDREGDGEEELR